MAVQRASQPIDAVDVETVSGAPAEAFATQASAAQRQAIVAKLGQRSIVMVGMMGAGKTSLGRRLAARLALPFVDADVEIELAAGMSISDIFARHGEPYFRDGERRVIARLLAGGPQVLATGGGAFMNATTREKIAASGLSIWLRVEFDVLMRRVRKRSNRPLLLTADPEGTVKTLMAERHPTYGLADIVVDSRDGSQETTVDMIMNALQSYLDQAPVAAAPPAERMDIRVDLPGRAYDIAIGPDLLASAGPRIAALVPGCACAIVTDRHVAALHLTALEASLDAAGVRHTSIVVAPGETSKSYQTFMDVCDALVAARIERGDVVVALGGGVVGDLAGFAAAVVRRGIRFVQIPTSLLAQVDSSVGGKTGINSPLGKNLVGAFHQPILVLADTGVLDTLPPREFRAGYAEVVKYGLINDRAFFEWLESDWRAVFSGGPARARAIKTSCAAKAAIVIRDETETGDRALLNLGHTFGHAFERLTHYDGARLVHGEAVAIGIACAFRFSARLGLCPADDSARVERHLRDVGLPTRIADIPGMDFSADALLDAMGQDKKVVRGRLTFILVRGIGASFIAKDVAAEQVRTFLEEDLVVG